MRDEKNEDKVAKPCSTCRNQFLAEGNQTQCESCKRDGKTLLNE